MMCVFFVWPTFDSVSWIAYENQITITLYTRISVDLYSYDVILFQDVLLYTYHPLMSRVKSRIDLRRTSVNVVGKQVQELDF